MFKKIMLTLMIAVLALSALPLQAQAAGLAEGDTPPADPARLEKVWARQVNIYNRLTERMGQVDDFTARVAARLDEAAAQGMDVSAAQAALEAFTQAVQAADPLYDQAGEIVAGHAGFDADGKVADQEQAAATVQALGDALKAIREATEPAAIALRQALGELKQNGKPGNLEQAWTRLQRVTTQAEKRAAQADDFMARAQAAIDRAAENGGNVAEAQAALDAFREATVAAQPLVEQAAALVDEHAGFDADGKVTDQEQAAATVQALGDTLKAIRDQVGPAGKALQAALKSLRQQFPGWQPPADGARPPRLRPGS